MYNRVLKKLYFGMSFLIYKFIMLFGKKWHRTIKNYNYQPLPWIGLTTSRRTDGTVNRWKQMQCYIKGSSSVLDIGCNVGYFVFKAEEKGCFSCGIDSSLRSNLISNYVKMKARFINAYFLLGRIDVDNIDFIPKYDYIIFLSVFHHWCAEYGLVESKKALSKLIQKSNKGFFFEMGQEEMDKQYNIPSMDNESKQWIQNLLQDISSRTVKWIGQSNVFVDKGRKEAVRHLFFVGEQRNTDEI